MLKCLAIFTILVAIMQTPAPVPRKIADNAADSHGNVENQRKDGKPTSQPAPTVTAQNGTGPANADAKKPDGENTSNTVTIRELPTVSVDKDWADWSYWGFGGVLVVVGALQVYLLNGTLRAVEIQGRHMERQTKILEDSVSAAQKSADAAIAQVEAAKSAQRAQLRVDFAPPEFDLQPALGGYPVNFRITVDGTTRAYVLDDSILVYLSQSRRTETARKSFGIPRHLRPEDSPYEGKTLIHNTEPLPKVETDTNRFYFARKGEEGYTLCADGRIYYRDIFGDEWILNIDRYWDTVAKIWAPFGSGRFDTHRKVEPHKTQSQNPN